MFYCQNAYKIAAPFFSFYSSKCVSPKQYIKLSCIDRNRFAMKTLFLTEIIDYFNEISKLNVSRRKLN